MLSFTHPEIKGYKYEIKVILLWQKKCRQIRTGQHGVHLCSLKKSYLTRKIIEPLPMIKSLIGYFRILMFYTSKKKKQTKNLFLQFPYPEPGSNRHSIAATGV